MIIDIIYLILLALAVFRGYSKGFIIAVFAFLGIFIGLAAALKLSVVVAAWLGKNTGAGERILPVLAFVIVLIGVAMLVRFCALLVEKSLQIAMLGFVNKLAGIVLYMILYTIVFSILLFFANKISLLKEDTITSSYFYSFIQPWGPKAISVFGNLIPIFKNMFQQLESFFGRVAEKSK